MSTTGTPHAGDTQSARLGPGLGASTCTSAHCKGGATQHATPLNPPGPHRSLICMICCVSVCASMTKLSQVACALSVHLI